jgi:2,4-dienoyl-CoA reductase-like NADH-dependent reductase (Old Yellow Enzyme family)
VEYDGDDERMFAESIQTVQRFKELGADFISVSIGFNIPGANIPWGPAFLASVSEQVRSQAGIPVATAWGVDTPELANKTIEQNQLDIVMVGRAHLENPNWPYFASKCLAEEKPAWVLPAPYAHWLERYTPPVIE